jgi:hypothetical protein
MRRTAIVVLVLTAIRAGALEASAQARIAFDSKGRILMHGVPRFVLGVYDSGLPYYNDAGSYETMLFSGTGPRQLGDVPINLYLNYHYGQAPIGPMRALMDTLWKHGVMYLQTANCFADGSYTRIPFSVDQSDDYVRQFAQHPGAAGYYIMDECTDRLIPETEEHHRRLKALDPASMTLAVTLARGYVDPRKWVNATDVLGSDPYPMFGKEPAAGYTHFQVADFIAHLKQAMANGSRPTLAVLQFFKFTTDSRWPTRDELRAHAVMSIVEGAKGIMWWELGQGGLVKADSTTRTTQMANLRELVKELAALEPALIADDAPGALVGNSTRYADSLAGRKAQLQHNIAVEWLWSNKTWYQDELNRLNAGDTSRSPMLKDAASIRTKVKVVNGVGYVFAYNYTNQSVPVRFTWHQAPGSVTEVRGGKSFPVSGSSWDDAFGPYQARIYRIGSGGSTAPSPTTLTLGFTNPASGATVSGTTTVSLSASGGTGYTYTVRVDGTQVYSGANPSFSWNTTTVADGTRRLDATVRDSSGRTASASRSVTVKNATTTPTAGFTASFSYPGEGASVSGSQSVGMATTATWGVTKTFRLTVDGVEITRQTLTGTTLWIQWDTTKTASGPRTLRLEVTMNGATAVATRTVSVANGSSGGTTLPALSAAFTSPAAGATVSGTTTVGMSASGASGGATFRLSLGSTVLFQQAVSGSTASYAWDTTKVAGGAQTLTLTVTDGAGRTATTTRSVTVSNPVPTASFTASFSYPAESQTVSGSQSVGMATTATWGTTKTFRLTVDGVEITRQTLTGTTLWIQWDTTRVASGTRTLRLEVTSGGETAVASRRVQVSN